MKKILLSLLLSSGLALPVLVSAQTATFTVPHDTVIFSAVNGGTIISNDPITNIATTAGLKIKWHVVASNFPDDWLTASAFGICDNNTCYYNVGDTALWRVSDGTTGLTYTSATYVYDVAGGFSLDLDLPTGTTDTCYYVTVALTDAGLSGYSKNITFEVCNRVTAVPNVVKSNDDVLLYPNPATNELNVVYSPDADIKNIVVYNVIGKVMTVYRVNGNSANLNLENIPSGIYFVRLMNSHGDPVVTRKFTKQ